MSHGCDTYDLAQLLGPLPVEGSRVTRPILFLLERPGADYCNGEEVSFAGFKKSPPNRIYYWTFDGSEWPENINNFNGNFYGPYFAYLMRKHALANVYITNLVKCRQQDGGKDARIEIECFNQYLRRELNFLDPALAFCFGKRAEEGLKRHTHDDASFKCNIVRLYHPIAIKLARRYHKTCEQCVNENDAKIMEALRSQR